MPLVRIDLLQGRPVGFGKQVGEVVYRAMVDTLHVPANDHFQVIIEHDATSLVYDPTYLNIPRTDAVIFIQITLNEGRTLDVKRAFYQIVARRLHHELGVRIEDILINLVEVKKDNWSFGNGVAQYAE
jgi:phenylpyruvate tautomerase PptA (4-oxalocrotonate tautomerase family)